MTRTHPISFDGSGTRDSIGQGGCEYAYSSWPPFRRFDKADKPDPHDNWLVSILWMLGIVPGLSVSLALVVHQDQGSALLLSRSWGPPFQLRDTRLHPSAHRRCLCVAASNFASRSRMSVASTART